MGTAVPQCRHFGGIMMQDSESGQPAVYFGGTAEPLQSYENGGSLEQKGVLHHAWLMVVKAKQPMMGQTNVPLIMPSFSNEFPLVSLECMHNRVAHSAAC